MTCVPGASHSRCEDRLARRCVQRAAPSRPRPRRAMRLGAMPPPSAAAPRSGCSASPSTALHRVGVRARLDAGAEDRATVARRSRERAASPTAGDRGRADLGDRRGVQDRPQLAGRRRREEHRALVRVEPARRVAGRDRRSPSATQTEPSPAACAGMKPIRLAAPGGTRHEPQRLVQLAARERAEDRRPSPRCSSSIRQQRADVVLGEDEHAHEKSAVS